MLELDKLYLNRVAIGGFSSVKYWSSSQSASNKALYQDFSTGTTITSDYSAYTYAVRAIRSF